MYTHFSSHDKQLTYGSKYKLGRIKTFFFGMTCFTQNMLHGCLAVPSFFCILFKKFYIIIYKKAQQKK